MNAHNDGTKIHFDTPEAAGNMFPFFPDVHGAPFDPIKAASHLTRWTVDMASNSDEFESRERLSEMVGEFPRIDDRYAGRKYRHGWMLGFGGPQRSSIGHVDLETGKTSVWDAGPRKVVQEPTFIPRRPDAREGEGWIATAATNTETLLTELLLLEATDIAKGPVATIRTPLHMKPAYHGNWFDGSLIRASGLV